MKNRKIFQKILFLLSTAFLAFSPNHAFSENSCKYLDGVEGKEPVFSTPLSNWKSNTILPTNPKTPAKTCILIIAPTKYGNNFIGRRWFMGKRVWESYMNSHPDVDCYFMVCANPRGDMEDVWIDGNTLYVGDRIFEANQKDRLLHKTMKAMEHFQGKYTHYIRTNINTFMNLKAVADFAETHSKSFYSTPLWENTWYTIGYGIVCTADVANHMVKEYNRLSAVGEKLLGPDRADDAVITALATGIYPYDTPQYDGYNPFRCSPNLKPFCRQLLCKQSLKTRRFSRYGLMLSPLGSLEEGIKAFNKAGREVMLVRTRDGLNLVELAQLYRYMFEKTYPELSIDLTGF